MTAFDLTRHQEPLIGPNPRSRREVMIEPRLVPAARRNVGPTPGKLLLTVIPGRFSNYFVGVAGLPDKNIDTIKTLCAKYDVEVLE